MIDVPATHLYELPIMEARKLILDAFTKNYLVALLQATKGNVSEAARRAGIDRSNFRRLIRELLGEIPLECREPAPKRTPIFDKKAAANAHLPAVMISGYQGKTMPRSVATQPRPSSRR